MRSRRNKYIRIRKSRGQTLVIAIMVMFLVALVAAVFLGLVARNLFRAERYSKIDEVAQIAEAGIRYADKMLTSGEEGADWRPVPDNIGVTNIPDYWNNQQPTPDDSASPVPGLKMWQYRRDKYPDYQWTRPYWPTELHEDPNDSGLGFAGPTGGYTTFNTGQGRFLLRVSYRPDMKDPLSKFIKIESIGRIGVFDENDPTTWKPHGNVALRRELTAYKPIGVTDYLRFITNKENRSASFVLGCPGYNVKLGRDNSSVFGSGGTRGAPIRVQGNLSWYGDSVLLNLRSRPDENGSPAPVDMVEIAGEVTNANAGNNVKLNRLNMDGSKIDTPDLYSSDTEPPAGSSWSAGGFYRDNSPQASEPTRRIKRIEPPSVDQADPTNTTTRYRLLTLNSGERIKLGNDWINLGGLGWGRGIYIGNSNDEQQDAQTLAGSYTLRSDWMKPNNTMKPHWKGPYYVPPGAVIVLHPEDTDGDSQPDLSITRTDSGFISWCDASGVPRPDWGHTVTMPYPDCKNGRDIPYLVDPNQPPTQNNIRFKHIDGNGVIYAEGNVRIRGMLPKGMQLTVVSGQNIYIEGNLLKYRDPQHKASARDQYRGADPSGGLALLAKQYVCVNTTQFFGPMNGIGADDVGSDAQNGEPPYHLIVSSEPDSMPRIAFDFGPWESDDSSVSEPSEWTLMLRHSGQFGTSYINAWLNPGSGLPDDGILALNSGWRANLPAPGLLPFIWGVGDSRFNAQGWGIGELFVGEAIPLLTAMNANLNTIVGDPNIFQIALDQSTVTRNNYLLGGMAIQPFDIRIEALIYAESGSFFVLPGNWFNPNPSDPAPAPDQRQGHIRPGGYAREFPFYGDPLDIRIIIDGAVSENIPAPLSDMEEWMAKWGRIPEKYGSSDVSTAHPGEGLAIMYDDHAGWPRVTPSDAASAPIRTDKYGRILPVTPRLPVSGSLIYFGDVI